MSCISRSTSDGVAREVRPVCAGLGAGQRSARSTAPMAAKLSIRSPFARLGGLYNPVGRYGGLNGDFVLVEGQGEVEADGVDELVEVGGDSLIEAVEMRSFPGREGSIG